MLEQESPDRRNDLDTSTPWALAGSRLPRGTLRAELPLVVQAQTVVDLPDAAEIVPRGTLEHALPVRDRAGDSGYRVPSSAARLASRHDHLGKCSTWNDRVEPLPPTDSAKLKSSRTARMPPGLPRGTPRQDLREGPRACAPADMGMHPFPPRDLARETAAGKCCTWSDRVEPPPADGPCKAQIFSDTTPARDRACPPAKMGMYPFPPRDLVRETAAGKCSTWNNRAEPARVVQAQTVVDPDAAKTVHLERLSRKARERPGGQQRNVPLPQPATRP